MVRNKWTPQELERLQERLIAGVSVFELALHYQIAPKNIYRVIKMYDLIPPKQCANTGLTPSEIYLSTKLVKYGLDIKDYKDTPKYCYISGDMLTYRNGYNNSAEVLKRKDGSYVIVTKHVKEMLSKYKPNTISKVSDFIKENV